MAAENFFFGIIAILMIVAAIRVVTTRNIVHAALWLVIVLAGVAAQFILLVAEFTAVTQVLVYIGAIVVLFLFGIMLTRAPLGNSLERDRRQMILGAVVAVALAALLGYVLVDTWGNDKIDLGSTPSAAAATSDSPGQSTPARGHVSPALMASANTQVVSDSIFRDYLIPFEAVSVLLLGALMGAIVLARRD